MIIGHGLPPWPICEKGDKKQLVMIVKLVENHYLYRRKIKVKPTNFFTLWTEMNVNAFVLRDTVNYLRNQRKGQKVPIREVKV